MIFILALFATLLGATGGGLTGLGVAMAGRGEVAPGLLSMAIGVLTAYGAYLFGRAAWRTSRALRGHPEERGARRKQTKALIGNVIAIVASCVLAPVPIPARVLGAIGAVLTLPMLLAREIEPPKRKRS